MGLVACGCVPVRFGSCGLVGVGAVVCVGGSERVWVRVWVGGYGCLGVRA